MLSSAATRTVSQKNNKSPAYTVEFPLTPKLGHGQNVEGRQRQRPNRIRDRAYCATRGDRNLGIQTQAKVEFSASIVCEKSKISTICDSWQPRCVLWRETPELTSHAWKQQRHWETKSLRRSYRETRQLRQIARTNSLHAVWMCTTRTNVLRRQT